ncbi:MAG: hypothetical protein IJF44_00590 [Clostridia bacterium]|nr:hypothetical protein [Clostridia bacterium]
MHNRHARNTVRYYVLIAALLSFLFFTNDFGLIDVQKTAIVMAAGIDREGDEFIITSQIAVPQASSQGKSTQAVQIVSRGKTVADAFEEINAKTGWYPKLVFCDLILIGADAAKENVFDALDYFLRDEYLTDNCYVATCAEKAQSLLNTAALVDPSSSVAMTKVLSDHAARVGTVAPSTLREFAIGYYGDAKSGFLPVIKLEDQQETPDPSLPSAQGGGQSGGQDAQQGGQSEQQKNKPVFSAQETALFVNGKQVETLTAEETFAYNAVKNSLQLAPYTVEKAENSCTLSIRQNSPKIKLQVGRDGKANLEIKVTLTAGILDYSKALPVEKTADGGDVPVGVFTAAEKKLSGEISSVFEKARACGCDLFGVQDLLVKKENRKLHRFKNTLLANTTPTVKIRFQGVR